MSEMYFERKTSHKIIIKKDGQEIGHIFSKGSYSGTDSIQICGFDRIEGSWNCANFYGKRDICLIFEKHYDEMDKLKEKVLNQIAKERRHDSWKKMIQWQKDYIGKTMEGGEVEHAVELALSAKQVEIEKVIDEFLFDSDNTEFVDSTLLVLKKRLLVKKK